MATLQSIRHSDIHQTYSSMAGILMRPAIAGGLFGGMVYVAGTLAGLSPEESKAVAGAGFYLGGLLGAAATLPY